VSSPLDLRAQLTGARLLVIGGTGFLGKVWLSMLLERFGDRIEHVYLVVRPKAGLDPEARFWAEVAPSGAFDPLRAKHAGPAYEELMRAKITPIPGDVSEPMAGIPEAVRDKLRGTLHAMVNAAGVVDFNPPLDDALGVNAFGMQSLVALAQDLGDLRLMHTSTCYVAGRRTGQVDEVDPREHPFPRAAELSGQHWDPDNEIAECVDVIEHVRHRSGDSFRQSEFLDEARRRLIDKGEPARGTALESELTRVRRKYEEAQLAEAGRERASFWGWPNTYTYTKSIGEQILADSGVPFCIVRPAVIESSLAFPSVGWNEGITTSAPIMYLAMKGMTGMPANHDSVLDVVPADMVAAGMILALAELLEGSHKAVYQLGTSDTNPFPMYRLIELTGLYKRRKFRGGGGSPLLDWIQANYQTIPVGPKRWSAIGPGATTRRLKAASGLLRRVTADVPLLGGALEPAAKALDGVAGTMALTDKVVDQYVPFTATHNYVFSCRNTRSALDRVPEDQQALVPWAPETIDWRTYWLDVHCPGVEKYVWPVIEDRIKRPRKALRPHDDLVAFLDEIAERHGHAPALLVRHPDGFSRVTFVELRDRARATAKRLLAAGVRHGDRVVLSGRNHPDWVVAFFGIQLAGAVAVPLDPGLEADDATVIADKAQPRLALLDDEALAAFGRAVEADRLDLAETTAPGRAEPLPDPKVTGDDVASILFTSGTTGDPKGVMLTHANFCSLLASLARVFDLGEQDRVLSVLPLHHTFEFTCGLLLPLSRGTRIVYLDEITGEALSSTLSDARITAMVGVPALWQLLERRMLARVADKGPMFESVFDAGLELNRWLGRATGLDVGRLIFGTVHKGLGGNIRLLISGGAALPEETHRFFAGLGLHLAEGYGLTEAAPVLTVDAPRPGARPGTVGRAIPGVELRIAEPDDQGVGEVLARGPNVMKGYFRNSEATTEVLDADGWLHTGDLGRIDPRGKLVVVGRAKDVVVTATGENVYLDDVEAKLGAVPHIEELSLVGLPDGRGGEQLGLLATRRSTSSHDNARSALRKAIGRLPSAHRPALLYLVDAPLPRTATRKVKRREVRDVLERIHEATRAAERPPAVGAAAGSPARRAIAQVAGRDVESLTSATRIADELAFDSLMWVELAAALDDQPGPSPDSGALADCETIADVEALLASTDQLPARAQEPTPAPADEPFRFPGPLVTPLRKALRAGQRNIYESLLDVTVTGRAHVPMNRQVLVVSNHNSHIDMGLVKTALGSYGEDMVALAAADYFFEGHPLWVAYVEQLTNLAPLARGTSYRQSLRQAADAVRSGRVVLIFPEGGRQGDGRLKDFKPLVGKLIQETRIDVLPMFLWGTHDALPKGAVLPRGRKVGARIGPTIDFADLVRLTEGLKPAAASRVIAQLLHAAVAALKDGSALDVSELETWDPNAERAPVDPMEALFGELPTRFKPDAATEGASWYFSLGGEEGRWTVIVEPGTCEVRRGKPPGGVADCVIKTSPDLWTRMVREAYVPEVSEFVTGAIKTSDLDKLQVFAQLFKLGPLDVDGEPDEAAEGGR